MIFLIKYYNVLTKSYLFGIPDIMLMSGASKIRNKVKMRSRNKLNKTLFFVTLSMIKDIYQIKTTTHTRNVMCVTAH